MAYSVKYKVDNNKEKTSICYFEIKNIKVKKITFIIDKDCFSCSSNSSIFIELHDLVNKYIKFIQELGFAVFVEKHDSKEIKIVYYVENFDVSYNLVVATLVRYLFEEPYCNFNHNALTKSNTLDEFLKDLFCNQHSTNIYFGEGHSLILKQKLDSIADYNTKGLIEEISKFGSTMGVQVLFGRYLIKK